MTHRRRPQMFRGFCSLQFVLLISVFSSVKVAQIGRIEQLWGVLLACSASDPGIALRIQVAGGPISISVSDLAWPHAGDRSFVRRHYAIDGPCPVAGSQIMVTQCQGCRAPAPDAIEVGGHGQTFDQSERRLWAVRQYFDLSGTLTDEPTDLFISSKVVSEYNHADGGGRSLWIRGELRQLLAPYANAEQAAFTIGQYGRSALLKTVDPIHDVLKTYGERVGLVRGLPYEPADPRKSPFVGWWGFFALEIFGEDGHGKMVTLYDGKAALNKN